MLLGQVLESDSDEPPNYRTLLLLLVISGRISNAGAAGIKHVGDNQANKNGDLLHLVGGDGAVEAARAGTKEVFARNGKHFENSHEGLQGDSHVVLRRQKRNVLEDEDKVMRIFAILLADTNSKKSYNEEGVISVYEKNDLVLHLVGVQLDQLTKIKFTTANNSFGGSCRGADGEGHFQSGEMEPEMMELLPGIARLDIPGGLEFHPNDHIYYLCVQDPVSGDFIHQGTSQQLQIETKTPFMPVWLMIVFIVICLCLSGLFSGLNLGLMSLDQTELKIVMSTGTKQEQEYATTILPVRALGNFLLCSILLGNVLVNNTLTIMLDTLSGGGGMVAVIGATFGIVIFGEIIPQAICSRHGLAVGAHTIMLTKFFMFITSPLSWPISKLLDLILGSEIGTVYNKERLMELLKVTDQYNDLEKDEVNIVTGALVLKQKCVKDIMTRLDDCYMLPLNSILDFETVSEIKDQGYSRIPVFDRERTNIVHILFAKDLLFIDPDDRKPIEEVCKFYKNEVNLIYDDTVLTDMFNEFKSGEKGHLAVVQEINNEGEGDPFYETVGLVTLEDIIEEIIQAEIIDETDIVLDNKSKKKRTRERYKKDADFKMFIGTKTQQRVVVSPQMSLAILQFLTTTIRPFFPENCSQRILQKLLKMDVFREIKLTKATKNSNNKEGKEEERDENEGVIMMKGTPCDFFVLIIEGRVEVTIGKENKSFQEGPFSCFGEQMLEQAMLGPSSPMPMVHSVSSDKSLPFHQTKTLAWVPDYTLKAVTDVLYLKVRKNTYMVAIKSCRMDIKSSESESQIMREEDIEEVLVKVTENDVDFSGKGPVISPENLRNGGPISSLRRNSLRRSLSSLRSKFYGRSTSSIAIEKNKDDIWDGMENQALNRSEEDVTREIKTYGNAHHINGNNMYVEKRYELDDSVVTMNELNKTVISIGKEDAKLSDFEPISITASNPSDRTSLLQSEHSLS
eukprot:GFUD01043936.1.p1 GENE.GFUD01043936.1~~GFUD01043936.1.p1  ORF type:complete len:964 (-),score=246.05 GFUD01043936.1:104-2995(-)